MGGRKNGPDVSRSNKTKKKDAENRYAKKNRRPRDFSPQQRRKKKTARGAAINDCLVKNARTKNNTCGRTRIGCFNAKYMPHKLNNSPRKSTLKRGLHRKTNLEAKNNREKTR